MTPTSEQTFVGNPSVDIRRDEVAVRRTGRRADEGTQSLVACPRDPPKHLVDDAVDAVIARVRSRHAKAAGIGQRQAVNAEALIREIPEMIPAPELHAAGKAGITLAAVEGEIHLRHGQRRIVDSEVRAVGVALLRVSIARPSGIAVEDRGEKRELIGRRYLDPNTRRRQRIGRTAARKIASQ